ncbi:Transcription factor, MADS-box [Artemisia annua]|uniref:Transcription factor, MADS-box n=1 Tax=Artemisia annua TaxID=35608 RepID=A0A2U1QEV5_ARTAN|nr:Transcription factor, MADS-box [Artemisia annua]
MVTVNNMNKKTSQGRKKIEIKKIEENNSRQVTFSKRRNRLFKKVVELCVLTGAKITIIVNSPGGRVFAFEKNVDVDVLETFMGHLKAFCVNWKHLVGQETYWKRLCAI